VTRDRIEALVKAGEALTEAAELVAGDCSCCGGDGEVTDSDDEDWVPCPDCTFAREALSSWRSALADLRAEEQPAPVPGDGRDVILDLVETCNCERYDGYAKSLVCSYRHDDPPDAGIAELLADRKRQALLTAAILAHLQGTTLRPVLLARRAVGIKTYGHPLHPGDVPALEYALDEAADLPIYIHQGELEQVTASAPTPESSRVIYPACQGRCRCEDADKKSSEGGECSWENSGDYCAFESWS